MAGPTAQDKNGTVLQTDADGRFDFAALPAGATRLILLLGEPRVSDDFTVQPVASIDLHAGDDKAFDFDLPDGAIRVTVLDDATGKPVEGAMVYGAPPKGGSLSARFEGFTYRPGWSAFSDSEGHALLRTLPIGEPHGLEVKTRDGREAKADAVLPSSSATPTEIVLRVKPKPPR